MIRYSREAIDMNLIRHQLLPRFCDQDLKINLTPPTNPGEQSDCVCFKYHICMSLQHSTDALELWVFWPVQ